jgi:hypothetical protein
MSLQPNAVAPRRLSLTPKSPTKLDKQFDYQTIAWEDVIADIELKNCLQQYLKTLHNEEPMLFMAEIDNYENIENEEQRVKEADKIIKKYIVEFAELEINLSNETRERITCKHQELALRNSCPRDLFDDVRSEVLFELKQSCYKNFINSDVFTKFIQNKTKQDASYLSRFSSQSSTMEEENVVQQYQVLEPQQIEKSSITLADFEWLEKETKHTTCSILKSFPDGPLLEYWDNNSIRYYRESAELKLPYEQVFFMLIDGAHIHEMEPDLVSHNHLLYLPSDPTSTKCSISINYYVRKLPFPLKSKRIVSSCSAKHHETNRAYLLVRKLPTGSLEGFLVEQLSDNTSKYTYLSATESVNWTNQKTWNNVMIDRCLSRYQTLLRLGSYNSPPPCSWEIYKTVTSNSMMSLSEGKKQDMSIRKSILERDSSNLPNL